MARLHVVTPPASSAHCKTPPSRSQVLCCSPVGERLRMWIRRFPHLLGVCNLPVTVRTPSIYSPPSCDWLPLRVYSLLPHAPASCCREHTLFTALHAGGPRSRSALWIGSWRGQRRLSTASAAASSRRRSTSEG
eukprot:3607461-Pyramimonas_sp.AAC.1